MSEGEREKENIYFSVHSFIYVLSRSMPESLKVMVDFTRWLGWEYQAFNSESFCVLKDIRHVNVSGK